MKKQFVCLTLFFSVVCLQAGPKNKKNQQGQAEQIVTAPYSTGSNSLLPVAPQSSEEETVHCPQNSLQSSQGLVSLPNDDDDFDALCELEDAQSSQKVSPINRNDTNHSSRRFLPDAPPAIACQTTMRNFHAHSSCEGSEDAPLAIACQTTMRNFHAHSSCEGNENVDNDNDTKSKTDQEAETKDEIIKGVDVVYVKSGSIIQKLEQLFEQQAQEKRTLIYSAIETLKKLGALEALEKTKDLAHHLTQQRLQRILSLDDTDILPTHLKTFTTEADQGEWLAKGLAQAIETKNINDVTRVLEIIQKNKLTNFVPTQHQEDAAQLLLQHTKKITSNILPQAQRISNPGDVSPRSKAAQATLNAIWQAYGLDPKEEGNNSTMLEILQQLKLKSASIATKK